MPLNLLLQKHDCCVSICHSKTPLDEIKNQLGSSEIIVLCCGDPEFVQASWIKQNAIIIDVGITYKEDKENPGESIVLGDCLFDEEMLQKVDKITPVPGGVGPMTITMLMNNLTHGWMRDNFDLR